MSLPRTLVVAPKTNLLLVEDEVQQVINTLSASVLQGAQCDIRALLGILANPYDIIWFATHGDEKGVYLSDGTLNVSEITPLVRSAGAKLVVFNTCSSRPIALSIYDELRIPTVSTLRPLPDRSAFIFGTIFARKIAAGNSYFQAFQSAKPGQNSTYVYLPETEITVEMPPSHPGDSNDLSNLTNSMRRLEILVSGSRDYNVKGLIPTVDSLETKVNALSNSVESLHLAQDKMGVEQKLNRRLLLFIIAVLVVLLLAVVVMVIGRWGG